MKINILPFFSLLLTTISYGQKPPIDTAAFDNWPTLEDRSAAISNNGKYAMYSVRNLPVGSATVMIHELDNDWKIALPGILRAVFTDDSRQTIFMQAGDSLCLLTMQTKEKVYIRYVKDFNLFVYKGAEWLAYQLKNEEKGLVLLNFSTGKKQYYQNVCQYFLNVIANSLVLITDSSKENDTINSVKLINLITNETNSIWKGRNAKNIVMDASGTNFAFMAIERTQIDFQNSIWYYKAKTNKAVEIVNDHTEGIQPNLTLDRIISFSQDGKNIFVDLMEKELPKPNTNTVKLNIWSYTDPKLQSQQLFEQGQLGPRSYKAVLHLQDSSHIVRLQYKNEGMPAGEPRGDFVIITVRKGEASENYWNKLALDSTFIETVSTGKRKQIPINYNYETNFSAARKYIIGHGPGEIFHDFFCYEIETGITRNITHSLHIPFHEDEFDIPQFRQFRGLFVGPWLVNDSWVLIYDFYDIWLVDPTGKKKPCKLTNGRSSKTIFRLVSNDEAKVLQPREVLILKAFNQQTKQNGFYRLKLGTPKPPELLFMSNYLFEGLPDESSVFPIKARDVKVYLVIREQTEQSPNIFWTTDFKTYRPVSNIHPEKEVNWFTSELINFKTADGISTQGVLYKPDNFNSTKKYPLIIHYYDKKSDEKNKYRVPVVDNGGELDIAWFTSHCYLVLLTDIHYKLGKTGESVYKAVVGAAQYMSRIPYVDKKHMAIQGHSFGGFETNYLITHSNLFAAAVSSSGVSDLSSCYGSLWPDGSSQQQYLEVDRFRIGTTPWERQDLYIKNSPIFYVGNVTTPVLLMANKNDANVHFEQGLEFFTALRRAAKRAWMLEYDNGGHGVWGQEYKDYILRMTQFLDHYLKGAPAPTWMTRGIPAAMKGIDDGFELDNEIRTPGPGLLIVPSSKKLTRNKSVRK